MESKIGMVRLTLMLMLLAGTAMAQQDSVNLAGMTKVQLAKVYLQEVQRVTRETALVAFDSVAADVPATKYTSKKFEAVAKKVASYNETLMEQFMEIIPYADKKELLESILYLKQL
jgi:hypothetical protein